nr:hypothetical protein [Tanacetum cinerariifolium]GEX43494.1 hypothetical protein [Tanacetum cinerariifolium]
MSVLRNHVDFNLFMVQPPRGQLLLLLLYVDDILLTTPFETLLQQIISSLHHKFSMTDLVNCNPSRTPVDIESKLGDDGESDPTLYRSLAGSLQYLTFSLPDITYALHQFCLYMHDLREPYFSTLKRILRARLQVIVYFLATTYSLGPLTVNRRFLVLVQRQSIMVRNLLCELHTSLSFAKLVYFDNVSVVYLSSNQCRKHVEINIHYVRDLVAAGQVRVLHVPSRYQHANIFTKGLSLTIFEEFRTSLSVRCPPVSTAGEC